MTALVRVPPRADLGLPGGWICLTLGARGIAGCTLPQPTAAHALACAAAGIGGGHSGPPATVTLSVSEKSRSGRLPHRAAGARRTPLNASLVAVVRDLRRYFAGEPVDLALTLDLGGATAFQRDVLRAVAAIPYGQTRTYGEIARAVGRPGAARAVGQVMARNPLAPIVPCHRVLASGGRLGGFGGGRELKRRLLVMEGAVVPSPER